MYTWWNDYEDWMSFWSFLPKYCPWLSSLILTQRPTIAHHSHKISIYKIINKLNKLIKKKMCIKLFKNQKVAIVQRNMTTTRMSSMQAVVVANSHNFYKFLGATWLCYFVSNTMASKYTISVNAFENLFQSRISCRNFL